MKSAVVISQLISQKNVRGIIGDLKITSTVLKGTNVAKI